MHRKLFFAAVLFWSIVLPPFFRVPAAHGEWSKKERETANTAVTVDSAAGKAPAASNVDLNELAARIARSMRNDPNLQGAWLFVDADDPAEPGLGPRVFRFRRVLDRSRALTQSQAMNRLITSALRAGTFSVDARHDRMLPVSQFLAELQDQIDLQPILAGSMVGGAYFEERSTGQGLNLVLRGRLANESQVEQIERISAAIMNRVPAWTYAGVTPSTHNRSALPVVPSSDATATLYFGEGLQNFWKGRYEDAAQGFQRATLESPPTFQYHYWRVVSELAQGKRQRAEVRMENLIRYFGAETLLGERPAVARSMERVQGTFRRDLQQLEASALVQVARTKNSKN